MYIYDLYREKSRLKLLHCALNFDDDKAESPFLGPQIFIFLMINKSETNALAGLL